MRSVAVVGLLILGVGAGGPCRASDELEAILLDKFTVQNRFRTERLRAFVTDSVKKAMELKDSDPEKGLDLLRAAAGRIDEINLLAVGERRAMSELIQPAVRELRDNSLNQRRDKATRRIDAFKDYLEISAFEGKAPGRSNAQRWEPANFWTPDGHSRTGRLYSLGTGVITLKFGQKEENAVPLSKPLIQVFGGFYVYDKNHGHHIFLTNREFYDFIWIRLAREFAASDEGGGGKTVLRDLGRLADNALLKSSVDRGDYFLRGLPNLEPIAGIVGDEDPFLRYLAQSLMDNGWPIPMERIYSFEMQDRLAGLTKIQLSAVKRTLFLLQAKDTAVSPLYAEILREETAKVLRSEYTNFYENDINRSLLYIFSQLK